MKISNLFSKTKKEDPKGEVSTNAKLLIRAGFIDKLGAGIYSYLPLGLKSIKNIERIVQEEMDILGAQEILMPAIHPKENWEATGRWEVKEMFKIEGGKLGLGWTHEEIVTPLVREFFEKSDDNFLIYQIQTKFRNEPRAKSGLLRGREFIMKDMYSFHQTEEGLDEAYSQVQKAYFNVYKRLGIEKETYLTQASGGTFSKYSHEFQTVTEAGEDTIFICRHCGCATNKEVKSTKCWNCGYDKFEEKKAIEVGNIFKLNEKYSEPFKLIGENGNPLKMGCYGIGISRLLGAIVEVKHDENGIILPKEISPFSIYLIDISEGKKSEAIYKALKYKGYEVLFDDRKKSPGEKFADCDLIGIPIRIIVSKKTLEKESVEIKKREEKTSKLVKIKDLMAYLKDIY